MNEQIQRIGFIPVRELLAIFIVAFVLKCFAQPAAPDVSIEVSIEEDGDYVQFSWEPVEEAESYYIYTSFDLNAEDWGEPIAILEPNITEYNTPAINDGRVRFYYVTAYAEVVIPDWLVLVDGDQFYGGVTIDPFYISKYQVTQEDYEAVMRVNPSYFQEGEDAHLRPVETVSWFDAIEYCNRLSIQEGLVPVYSYLEAGTDPDEWPTGWNQERVNHTNVSADWEAGGYRLPTEAEWHHAANGGRHPAPFIYSGSDDIDVVAWYIGNSESTTHSVGSKVANGLGIYDMSGNVVEWCWDISGGTWRPNEDNPRGPDDGHFRMLRGGGWNRSADHCTVFFRRYFNAVLRFNDIGFRVVRDSP